MLLSSEILCVSHKVLEAGPFVGGLDCAWTVIERGMEARSGQGCPAITKSGRATPADVSEVLPRRGKTSVPAKAQTRHTQNLTLQGQSPKNNSPGSTFRGQTLHFVILRLMGVLSMGGFY